MGSAALRIFWPPAELKTARVNDTSLVMSVRLPAVGGGMGRRIILNGDIQQRAISELLVSGADLRADVCDLPHHGSRVKASPRWIEAVSPQVVLQSCGPTRWFHDNWRPLLRARGIRRLVTARDGMVELIVRDDGSMRFRTFLNEDRGR